MTQPAVFIWYELMTSDPVAATAFYKAVVGWKAEDSGMPGVRYTVLKAGDYGVGGIMTHPPGTETQGPFWIGYIGVQDADATVRGISEAGGKVLRQPGDIPGVGRFAVVTDPQGAAFMVMAPQGEAPPAPPRETEGLVGWRELMTSDWRAAFDFYAGQFGWTRDRAVDLGPMGTYQLFSAGGGEPAGGMMTDPQGHPPHWNFYFQTDDVDAAAERVRASGGEVVMGPMDVPDGSRVLLGRDPQAGYFGMVRRKREAA